MRKRMTWMVLLAALWAPRPALAQYYEVPPVAFTGPLSHPRYEDGGFFTAMQFLYLRQTVPLDNQLLAFRGFIDVDGSILGLGQGRFIGSGTPALDVEWLDDSGTYQPGFNLTLGWRFESGVSLQASWWHLAEARYSRIATLAPSGLSGAGGGLSDTFLTAPVFNFPIEFAGNPQNVTAGNNGATFGIWNAATQMQIEFQQRYDHYDLTGRIPIWQTDYSRYYGLLGGRIVGLWERFRWRTVDADQDGVAGPDTTAIYNNIISNRLYGFHLGCGNEWFLGDTPIGAFSCSLDVEGGLYIDYAKLRAKWERADRAIGANRARNQWSLVPSVEAKVGMWWYPWEGVTVQLGYNVLSFFNTFSSRNPVDFDYGRLDPEWDRSMRLLYGLTLGVGFVF